MIHGAIRVVTFLFAALAIPVGMLATPLSASADGPGRICETFGNFCAGSADVNPSTPVVERNPGREIVRQPVGGTVNGFPAVLLRFNANPNVCVGAANNREVVIVPCSVSSSAIWGLNTSSGHDRYLNAAARLYLSGHNAAGSQFFLAPLGTNGAFQQFDFLP